MSANIHACAESVSNPISRGFGRCSATVELVNISTIPLFLMSGYFLTVEPFILFLPWIHLSLRM